jgi:N-methylhydantoinase B
VVSVQTPGGGGTESARQRPAEGVARDVALGKISAERARAVYGVIVETATLALDAAATAAERARRA